MAGFTSVGRNGPPPAATDPGGWRQLLAGHPWFTGEGRFPVPAYSEFMPPPRLGRKPYPHATADLLLVAEDDPYGWRVSEMEEEYELRPGLDSLADQIVKALARLGQTGREPRIGGRKGRNLEGNPYWPPELARSVGRLAHEHYVTLLPVALSKTQDDKGRVRWTFFGASEQGPERAFWQGFCSAPGQERRAGEALAFILRLLLQVYDETAADLASLLALGFRILPTTPDPRFPSWAAAPLPSWTAPFLLTEREPAGSVRYLLTFRSFTDLPSGLRERYLSGSLHLLPFPGSLVFWGMPGYLRLQEDLPLGMQVPLLRLVARRQAPGGIRVPQSGWLDEPRRDGLASEITEELLSRGYVRTNRFNRVNRYDDELALIQRMDPITRVLFATDLNDLGLYNKPMARDCQIWTADHRLLLDGPRASKVQIERAASVVADGGDFGYRFLFPAMRVGAHEVYWHRPLVAWAPGGGEEVRVLPDAPLGYLTAYDAESLDVARPIELWPRVLQRETYLPALQHFDDRAHDLYQHQTPTNIVALLDNRRLWGGGPLARSFARQIIRVNEQDTLDEWLDSLPRRADDPGAVRRMRKDLEELLEPPGQSAGPPAPITYDETATRTFEIAYWQDIVTLAHGQYTNKDNADIVQDEVTRGALSRHDRDLEAMGDYILSRHRQAIGEAGMGGSAFCGDLPFHWSTDFDFSVFGGWKANQDLRRHERNLLVIVPGKDRSQAVVMADH